MTQSAAFARRTSARVPRCALLLPLLLTLSGSAFSGEFIPAPKLATPVPVATPTPPAAPSAAPSAAAEKTAVAATATPAATPAPNIDANGWLRLIDGSNLACDPNFPQHPRIMLLNNGMQLAQEDWEGYLKPFISSLPPSKRAVVLDALTRFQTEYDTVDGVIRFDPPPERDYQGQSWVSIVGSISPKEKKIVAALMISAFGDTPLHANRIKVVTDGAPWDFERLTFHEERDPPHIMEYVYLPLAEEGHYNLTRAILRAKQANIRVYGDQFYTDFVVTERVRKDLYAMLMAVDAIHSLHASQGVDIP